MTWSEQPVTGDTTTLFSDILVPGGTTGALDVSAFATASIWLEILTAGAVTRGAIQALYSDPSNTSGNTNGPWMGYDNAWDTSINLYSIPIVTPALTIVNTGQSNARVSVSASIRASQSFVQYGDEVGIRTLSALAVATGTYYTLLPASGPGFTRFNGRCIGQVRASPGSSGCTIRATYTDATGTLINQDFTIAAPSSGSVSFDFMHPSVPIRWTVLPGVANQTVTLTLSQG